MKIAVVSDIHSNLVALEAVKADIEAQGIDQVHCLGDTLGYGPWPLECLNIVLTMCQTVLKGNHEDAVCHPDREMDLNRFAAEGIRFSRDKLSKDIIAGIDKFPYTKVLPHADFVLCHGSYTEPSMWKYLDSPHKTREELKETPNRICLVGHTHSPFVFGSKRNLYKFLPDELELDPEQKYIINVGSVGQPRDGDVRACYGVFDLSAERIVFSLKRVFYDISKVEKAIRAADISIELAERLYAGE